MALLAEFLKTGALGPIILGMSPLEVIEQIGDPEQESPKKNPLLLKYGALQMVFAKAGNALQLLDIALNFIPNFEPLPPVLALEDFHTIDKPTEDDFRHFAERIHYLPAQSSEKGSGRPMIFLSGVVANFEHGLLSSIRITQKAKREITHVLLSDVREPSRQQILEMMKESIRSLQLDSRRSALVMAWAALEASLRRAALRTSRSGQIGIQSAILIRELLSAGILSPEEAKHLERLRQLRTTVVHGLAPENIPSHAIDELNALSTRMLADTF